MTESIEYGSVKIVTSIPLTPRQRISLRATCRRLDKAIEQSAKQSIREFERFMKTPAGEKWFVDQVVKDLSKEKR